MKLITTTLFLIVSLVIAYVFWYGIDLGVTYYQAPKVISSGAGCVFLIFALIQTVVFYCDED